MRSIGTRKGCDGGHPDPESWADAGMRHARSVIGILPSRDQLKEGSIKLIMQLALKKHAELPDVPLVADLVPEGEGKRVMELIFARQSMGRPIVAPPGLDPNVTLALRTAFRDVMRDPEFVAECERINLEINFVSGEDVESLVKTLFALPESVINEARKIVAAK